MRFWKLERIQYYEITGPFRQFIRGQKCCALSRFRVAARVSLTFQKKCLYKFYLWLIKRVVFRALASVCIQPLDRIHFQSRKCGNSELQSFLFSFCKLLQMRSKREKKNLNLEGKTNVSFILLWVELSLNR